MTIAQIRTLREKEDHVEFKECQTGNFSVEGGKANDVRKRRRCVIGYCAALANEGGGHLIFGVREGNPNQIVGTSFLAAGSGELQTKIYHRLGIRVMVKELYDDGGRRVVVLKVPCRPPGKALEFEDVALMRVGDELRPMAKDMLFGIINEREPDFSATVCPTLTEADLDPMAFEVLKRKYASHQGNELFLTQPNEQILRDLDLITPEGITYAALILLGRREALRRFLPQANVRLEWRAEANKISFDERRVYEGAYLNEVDRIWNDIDLRNSTVHVQRQSHLFPVRTYDERVIREVLVNAIAHRSYQSQGEVVLRQYPTHLIAVSPGGFPLGVSLDNLLRTASTPRNRLLTDVLGKLGEVERSGQGIDLIFHRTVSAAKGLPDYSRSDDYQVEVKLPGVVRDEAFAAFINQVQYGRAAGEGLSIDEVITLEKIRSGEHYRQLPTDILANLLNQGLIEKRGRTNGVRYHLSKAYYLFADRKGQYSRTARLTEQQHLMLITNHLKEFGEARMRDFNDLLGKDLSVNQIRRLIYKLTDASLLVADGNTRGRTYRISPTLENQEQILTRAVALGLELMVEQGEISVVEPPQNQKYE